ncbi:MAG: UvrD-helicase domain-containing protein [Leptospirillum sp.]
MDAFERVRELAREKNKQVREGLSDPLKALILSSVLASKASLELWPLDPSSTLLNGSLAVLARLDGAIYHVNNISQDDLALLIAHELGHFYVHAMENATSCSQDDVDISAPDEASLVGVDRVAGYGARERQELQANVFAREFLLPRSQARMLYLDQGKTPAAIAISLGLPLAVVRQQLIDALLIPKDTVHELDNHENEDLPLDSFQAKAATFSGAPLLLEAGPGTGKTRTLIARIVHLIKQNVDPASIVALTFSNKAAQEISERVGRVLPAEVANIWTGTFHAFGLEFIRKYHDHPNLGYSPDVAIIDRSEAVGLLEEVLPLLPLQHYKNLWDPLVYLKDILGAISRAKDELVSPSSYRQLAQQMLDKSRDDDSRKTAEKALEVARVYERYDELLKKHKLLDFGDLIMKPALLLEEDDTLRLSLQMQYRHVLVDEYQDVNRASAKLLKSIAGDGSRIWVVGDARQSIYRFRGASAANIARFNVDFPGAERLNLGMNYRSTQEITNAYCGFSDSMVVSTEMPPLQLTANRGRNDVTPEVRQVRDEEDEQAAAAASVHELEGAGVPLREQAMLFRTNSRLSAFASALETRGIAVLHLGSLFEREEIRNLLSLLSFIVDTAGSSLVRLATMEPYQIPLPDVSLFFAYRRQVGARALEALKEASKLEGISEAGRKGFADLTKDLDGFDIGTSPWDVLFKYLFERSKLLKTLVESEDIRNQLKCVAIWQLLNFVREPILRGKGPPIYRLLERIRHLVLLGDERDLRQIPNAARHANAVKMLTIHGSKGLEFEAVHIPGMTKGQLPGNYRGVRCSPPDGMVEEALSVTGREYTKEIHIAEEECLYFVAMSRARTHLRHYASASKPSGFISRVKPPLRNVWPVPLVEKPSSSIKEWVLPNAESGSGTIDAERLSQFEKCPRRFLYSYLLELEGRQQETPFIKAHNCVYETIRAAKKLGSTWSKDWLLQQLEAVWKDRGPLDHAYEKDYRNIAQQTILNFHTVCEGLDFQEVEALIVDLVHGKVEVNPDQIARLTDGTMLIRRIRTGKVSDEEEDEWIYTFYHASASERYGQGRYQVEAVHLTSNTRTVITPSSKKMKNRIEKATISVQNIRAGTFPPQPDPFTCPRCPHFFYCPALPDGMAHFL